MGPRATFDWLCFLNDRGRHVFLQLQPKEGALGVPALKAPDFLCLLQEPTILFRKHPDILDG